VCVCVCVCVFTCYFLSLCVKDEIKDQGIPQLEAVFISVDPDRDTPAVMKNYLKGKLNYLTTMIN